MKDVQYTMLVTCWATWKTAFMLYWNHWKMLNMPRWWHAEVTWGTALMLKNGVHYPQKTPIPVVDMEKEISGNCVWRQAWRKIRPKKGAHERQADKLATGCTLYRPQKFPESQPSNESLSMKAKKMALTIALPQEKRARGRLRQSEGEGGNGDEGEADGYRAGGVVAMASSARRRKTVWARTDVKHVKETRYTILMVRWWHVEVPWKTPLMLGN